MIRRKNGFTLVELLVVISIMSILSVITFAQFQTAKKKANDVARKGDLNAINKSLLMHFADYGYFPTEINEGTSDDAWCPNENDCEFRDVSGYSYLKTLPKEKVRNQQSPYCYLTSGGSQPKAFALFAQLENTEDRDCRMDGEEDEGFYSCNGRNYCYAVLSPNGIMTSPSEVGAS